MPWNVEFTDEFGRWYEGLVELIQDGIDRAVHLLEAKGPQPPFPHSSGIERSRHAHMRELRVQSGGDLIGGNKAGDDRFYDTMIPIADRLYDDT